MKKKNEYESFSSNTCRVRMKSCYYSDITPHKLKPDRLPPHII